jgi:hypothetical protein
MSFSITVKQLVALLGGWSVILVLFSAWISRFFTERVLSKWRRDEQTSVEEIRSSLANVRLLLESAIRSFQTGQDTNQGKQLAAVERFCTAVLHLRDKFSGIVFFYAILMPDEYDSAHEEGGALGASISAVNDTFIIDAMRPVDALEGDRPYLGETLWARFFIYRAFLGRLGVLINEGKRKAHIVNWKEDNGVRQLLGHVLSPETLTSVLETKNPTTIRIAINTLETAMLEEISLIIFRTAFSFREFQEPERFADFSRRICPTAKCLIGSFRQLPSEFFAS